MSTGQRVEPVWFEKEVRFFAKYGKTWGVVHYVLAAVGVVAPIVAWLISGAPNSASGATAVSSPAGQNAIWATVGFWSAIAAVTTGLNSLLGAGARYENAWKAHDYLFLAGVDYRVDPQLTEKFLSEALRTAYEIFTGKQRPATPTVDDSKGP